MTSLPKSQCAIAAFVLLAFMIVFSYANSGDPADKFENMPLSSVYTTGGQKRTKLVDLASHKPMADVLEKFEWLMPRASNIFLTREARIEDAMLAGIRFSGSHVAILPGRSKTESKIQIWLVVYFGRGHSAPPAFTVESVQKSQKKIRLTYATPTPFQSTRDSFEHFAYVPMENLKAGTYDLELVHQNTNQTMLTRRVLVKNFDDR